MMFCCCTSASRDCNLQRSRKFKLNVELHRGIPNTLPFEYLNFFQVNHREILYAMVLNAT